MFYFISLIPNNFCETFLHTFLVTSSDSWTSSRFIQSEKFICTTWPVRKHKFQLDYYYWKAFLASAFALCLLDWLMRESVPEPDLISNRCLRPLPCYPLIYLFALRFIDTTSNLSVNYFPWRDGRRDKFALLLWTLWCL